MNAETKTHLERILARIQDARVAAEDVCYTATRMGDRLLGCRPEPSSAGKSMGSDEAPLVGQLEAELDRLHEVLAQAGSSVKRLGEL